LSAADTLYETALRAGAALWLAASFVLAPTVALAQPTCPSGAPVVDTTGTFKPNAPLERLEVRSGRPGAADWEWGLGRNTQQAGAFVTGQTNWVSGRDYAFTLTYGRDGTGTIVVRDGTTTIVDAAYTNSAAPLRTGNALRIAVKTSEGVGASRSIRLAVTSVNGHPVDLSVTESGNFSETAVVLVSADLLAGFTLNGTIRLVFPGPRPPQGSRMNAFVTAGNVDCRGGGGQPPPTIGNLMPLDGSALPADALPLVSGTFSDAGGGVEPASGRLLIDGVDVTGLASFTATGFSYSPTAPLPEGKHSVTVSIANRSGTGTQSSWSFTTSTPPAFDGAAPESVATTLRRPIVQADFSDIGAGVDPATVLLSLDGVDVTAQATVSPGQVVYVPATDLPAGVRSVSLQITDRVGNVTRKTWTFTIVVPPPPDSSTGARGLIDTPSIVAPVP
jgi:hypothetical protein